jgi:hypothetical protein
LRNKCLIKLSLKLGTFEDYVEYLDLRRTKEEEARGNCVRHEELHNLHSSPNLIRIKPRRMEWAGRVTHMGQKMNAYMVLVGKPEGKRPKCRW